MFRLETPAAALEESQPSKQSIPQRLNLLQVDTDSESKEVVASLPHTEPAKRLHPSPLEKEIKSASHSRSVALIQKSPHYSDIHQQFLANLMGFHLSYTLEKNPNIHKLWSTRHSMWANRHSPDADHKSLSDVAKLKAMERFSDFQENNNYITKLKNQSPQSKRTSPLFAQAKGSRGQISPAKIQISQVEPLVFDVRNGTTIEEHIIPGFRVRFDYDRFRFNKGFTFYIRSWPWKDENKEATEVTITKGKNGREKFYLNKNEIILLKTKRDLECLQDFCKAHPSKLEEFQLYGRLVYLFKDFFQDFHDWPTNETSDSKTPRLR